MIKCYCGFIWTDEALLKGYEKDDYGIFFRCPIDPNDYSNWNICMGFVVDDWDNGQINDLFPQLYHRFQFITKQRKIERTQKMHKFTLDSFF